MKILFEGTKYESLEIKRKYNEWNVTKGCDGDVCIECEDANFGNQALVLNQEDIKTLVTFLQKQILNQNK